MSSYIEKENWNTCERFFSDVKRPLVLVSTLPQKYRETVVRFLLSLNAPVYLEGISGLREDRRLQFLRVGDPDPFLKQTHYQVDGILRLGGVPTPRLWRDLETQHGKIHVLSVSHLPFKGLSWGELVYTETYDGLPFCRYSLESAKPVWVQEQFRKKKLKTLFTEFPLAEPSILFALSQKISSGALVYLGNSLPIREWDLFASEESKNLDLFASRGVNGIDGQLSTFLGMCALGRDHWGFFGDLTTLYDLAAPWILPQLKGIRFQMIVINNGGGMIFSRHFPQESFLNRHRVSFEPFAQLWGMGYHRLEKKKDLEWGKKEEKCLVEIIPNKDQTAQFWEAYK